MADLIRAKVEAGEYASESEVIRDGLRVLIARDQRWRSGCEKRQLSSGETGARRQASKTRANQTPPALSGALAPARPAVAPEAAPAPLPPKAEHAVQPRTLPETPSFEFGRMQVGLGPTGRE